VLEMLDRDLQQGFNVAGLDLLKLERLLVHREPTQQADRDHVMMFLAPAFLVVGHIKLERLADRPACVLAGSGLGGEYPALASTLADWILAQDETGTEPLGGLAGGGQGDLGPAAQSHHLGFACAVVAKDQSAGERALLAREWRLVEGGLLQLGNATGN